jgi:hypothetical protein
MTIRCLLIQTLSALKTYRLVGVDGVEVLSTSPGCLGGPRRTLSAHPRRVAQVGHESGHKEMHRAGFVFVRLPD